MSNTTKHNIGKDGVVQIYADLKGGSQVYMGSTGEFDEDVFNVSYGGGSHIEYEAKKEGKLNYFTTKGHPISYHSGADSGVSARIDTYPGKGMWKDKTDYYWKDNPGYLYNEKGILNGEYTTFIRVHKTLGSHQAYAHKIGGRDEDALRSLSEMVYPTSGKEQVSFNFDYAHFPYVHAKAKGFNDLDQFGEDYGWLALKTIHIVNDDYTHWEMWADFNPIDKDGSINNNWEKIAEYKDEGCDAYGNVAMSWKSQKEVCRVDGWAVTDFALFSDREIDPKSKPNVAKVGTKITEQTKPVVDNSKSGISVEEVKEAQAWLCKNPNVKLVDIINKIAKEYGPDLLPTPNQKGQGLK